MPNIVKSNAIANMFPVGKRIPGILPFYKKLGYVHTFRNDYIDNTSSGVSNLPLSIALHADGGRYPLYSRNLVSAGTWGQGSYNSDYIQGERAYFAYYKLRLIIRNQNENATIRICIVSPKKNGPSTAADPYNSWDSNVNAPYTNQFYNVHYTKYIKFDGPANDTLRDRRVVDFFFPVNKEVRTVSERSTAVSAASWRNTANMPPHMYKHLMIDTNDGSAGDSQTVKFDMYIESKFWTMDNGASAGDVDTAVDSGGHIVV